MATNPTGPTGQLPGSLPPSPWVLVDDTTIEATALLLERLVGWLATAEPSASSDCANALSLGEDDCPDTVATWADALAARLRHCAQGDLS